MAKKREILIIDAMKDKMELYIRVKAPEELEDFFKGLAMEEWGSAEADYTQISSKWKDKNGVGIKFYKNNKKLQDLIAKYIEAKLNKDGGNMRIANEAGHGLYDPQTKINIAILRIAGIAGKDGVSIKTTDLIAYEEIKLYIEEIAKFMHEFYGNFLKKQEIKSRISWEI